MLLHRRQLACLVMTATLAGCASGPITIDGGSFEAPSCLLAVRGRLLEVVDRRGYSDPTNIGFTQTGFFNKKTSLHISPPPPAQLETRLRALLENCSSYGGKTPTPLAFKVELSSFQVMERTGFSEEMMRVDIGYTVQVFADDGVTFLASYDVEGSASVKVESDTTDFAKPLVQDALREATANFMWRGVEVFRKYGG